MDRFSRKPGKSSKTYDEDDDDQTPPPIPPIAEKYLQQIVPLGRLPRNDEEKHEIFIHIIRLKENRLTNKECADRLGISERTIVKYMADPYYEELALSLRQDAKKQGHLLISEVIDEAVNKLHTLMHTARSEFVQYKSAEYLLKIAGYEEAQDSHRQENGQADVIAFLSKLNDAKRMQVNIQVNNTAAPGQVVEASIMSPMLPQEEEDELAAYRVPLLPGGKLPPE